MNKADLIEAVHATLGGDTPRRAAADAVDAVLEAIAKGVKKHGSVQVVGFGSFKVVERKPRMGRNIHTGQPIQIKESKTVLFTPAAALKASL